MDMNFIDLGVYVCRVDDYWEGYKLFCYAYYSHSCIHETEFRQSKLGSCIDSILSVPLKVIGLSRLRVSLCLDAMSRLNCCRQCLCSAGRVLWQRLGHHSLPSHHVVRTTFMQLLPLVEMYCRWELEEDCSDLRALMLCFDSELELESHELGRSLLFMIRDEDVGIDIVPRHEHIATPTNPFELVRERLAAADLAIRDLRARVHITVASFFVCYFHGSCVVKKKHEFALL